jgi:PAS domain S-box-containing protein
MPKKELIKKHFISSFAVLVSLIGFFGFALFALHQPVFTMKIGAYSTDTFAFLQFKILAISAVVISTLIAYIIYLYLTSDTRTQLLILSATKDLFESKEQLLKIYESAPVPYLTLDNKGDITDLNKAALRFFGVVAEEMLRKNFFSFLVDEDKERAVQLAQHYGLRMPINREEVRMVNKNGDVHWVLLSVFDMGSSVKNSRLGLVTVFDIDDQKKLDQTKTEFVSLASHQLRTPLATFKWYIEMLLSGGLGELPQKPKEYVSKLCSVNEEMIGLVDTLLNVSRLELGKLVVEKKPTDIQEIVVSILTELSSQITKKNITIKKEYGSGFKNFESDPHLLRIAIHNLLTNAVKYTPEAGCVTITLGESLSGKVISVSDTGVGIPKSEQGKIFQKLFRASNVKDVSASQSTGLGLYLIKSIVENLGGKISFESEEGKGSTFTITF